MKSLLFIAILFFPFYSFSQSKIDWSPDHNLQLSDFQSPATEIGNGEVYSINSGISIDFSFYMSNAEFMFTKNFNPKVNTTFNREASVIIAADSAQAQSLLSFAKYDFDLAELYARKFRKKIYEEKGAFSSVEFFKPAYEQIEREHAERRANAAKVTEVGSNSEKLSVLRAEVLREIDQLNEYCKSCRPVKKKNK